MVLKVNCPSCGLALGELPAAGQDLAACAGCAHRITWQADHWDACVDRSYPRPLVRQWILWDAGKLGDRNRLYGNDPDHYFDCFLKDTSLTEEQLGSLKILEVGYGHGRMLQQLQRCSPTAYGLDLGTPLKSARLRPGSVIAGNLLTNPLAPRQFDLVVCRGVVHFTPEPERSFARVADQVADGGMLYMAGVHEPGKGNLILRKILPGCWRYPESVRLRLASVASFIRSWIHAIQTGNLPAFDHYKLDVFEAMSPRWSSAHAETEVLGWFASQGFQARKASYGNYVGVRTR
jgi:SAM-dependent methyltransferase